MRSIEKWRNKLEEASVERVEDFIERVRSHAKVPENVDSFLCEARAALMFREHGFSVKMRDKPDLELMHSGTRLFAEVKHFRLKEQDEKDKARLEEAGRQALEDNLSTLILYGDLQATKEKKPAWQQLVNVARSKIDQYQGNSPNVLVIFSSSTHCVEDADFITAVHALNDEMKFCKTPGLEKLSGLLFVTTWIKVSSSRQVYFEPLPNSVFPLPHKLCDALSAIRYCKWDP